MKKKILFILLAIFLSVFVLFFGSEVLLRIIPSSFKLNQERLRYNQSRTIMQAEFCEPDPDPNIGVRNIPNKSGQFENVEFNTHLRFNSMGFRGPEVSPLEKDQKRILVLGDSFTVGWGVEENETFVDLLDKANSDIQFINLGVAGLGTRSQWAQLSKYGPQLKPDAVLLVVYQNDVGESGDPRPYSVITPKPFKGFKKLYAAHFFRDTHLKRLLGISKPRVPFYEKVDSGLKERAAMYVDKMKAWCENNGAQFFLAYIPDRNEIHETRLVGVREWITAYAEKNNILFSDITLALQQQEKPAGAYFRLDDHMNSTGHRIVFNEVSKLFPK